MLKKVAAKCYVEEYANYFRMQHGISVQRYRTNNLDITTTEKLLLKNKLTIFEGKPLRRYNGGCRKYLLHAPNFTIGGRLLIPKSTRKKRISILAIICVYNEIDIIEWTIKKLLNQGINVHIIDNWSCDGSFEVVERMLTKSGKALTLERYPAKAQNTFELKNLLFRVQGIATRSNYDWFIHHDADELRESIFPHMNYRQGVELVDALGYSAINHSILDFRPVQGSKGYSCKVNPESHFKYFQISPHPTDYTRINCWKKRAKLSLIETGGHSVLSDQKGLFPFNFFIRHYSFRSRSHWERKICSRASRLSLEEHKMGWHNHIVSMSNSGYQNWQKNFVKKKSLLRYTNTESVKSKYLVELSSSIRFHVEEELKPYIESIFNLTNNYLCVKRSKFYRFWQYFNFLKRVCLVSLKNLRP